MLTVCTFPESRLHSPVRHPGMMVGEVYAYCHFCCRTPGGRAVPFQWYRWMVACSNAISGFANQCSIKESTYEGLSDHVPIVNLPFANFL